MNHLMIDIETMGCSQTAAIVSIAAVEFDMTGRTGETFYNVIDLQSCLDYRLEMDGSTVMWWLRQSEAARKELTESKAVNLPTALLDFSAWINKREYEVWANGARFDLGILSNAYQVCGIAVPWHFRKERDVRTLVSVQPGIKKLHVPIGTAHHALDDCNNQIMYLTKTWQWIYAKLEGNIERAAEMLKSINLTAAADRPGPSPEHRGVKTIGHGEADDFLTA
jgi:DNA polymerase III epsilon subunit-like protein